mmetsp:Transcript_8372/g.26733  ORF Transcript_8372/g.26733 Transcript_8372/m.26733 type:complete len:228 (-) Transcript_8372:569-1252(-)
MLRLLASCQPSAASAAAAATTRPREAEADSPASACSTSCGLAFRHARTWRPSQSQPTRRPSAWTQQTGQTSPPRRYAPGSPIAPPQQRCLPCHPHRHLPSLRCTYRRSPSSTLTASRSSTRPGHQRARSPRGSWAHDRTTRKASCTTRTTMRQLRCHPPAMPGCPVPRRSCACCASAAVACRVCRALPTPTSSRRCTWKTTRSTLRHLTAPCRPTRRASPPPCRTST